MLVLTRKFGQEIVIDGCIVIRILKTGSGSVKIGIDAPPEIDVLRAEVFRQMDPADFEDVDATNLVQV